MEGETKDADGCFESAKKSIFNEDPRVSTAEHKVNGESEMVPNERGEQNSWMVRENLNICFSDFSSNISTSANLSILHI